MPLRWPPRRLLSQLDEALGLGMSERPEQHAVEKTENRGVGAKTERYRQHGDGGEAGTLSEAPEREMNVGGRHAT